MAGFAVHGVVELAEQLTGLCIDIDCPEVGGVQLIEVEAPCQTGLALVIEVVTDFDRYFRFGDRSLFKNPVAFVHFSFQCRHLVGAETQLEQGNFKRPAGAHRRQGSVNLLCKVWHKAVTQVQHGAVRLDVQAKQGIENRNAGVLLLHPNVRNAVVFGLVRIGNPHIGHILAAQIEGSRITL